MAASVRYFLAVLASLALAACGGEDAATRGERLFAAHCAICHGADARGGGGASVPGLSKTPADLTLLARRNGGDFPVAAVAALLESYATGTQTGRRMAPFTGLQSDRRRRVATAEGRITVSRPVAEVIDYLRAKQEP